MSAITKILQNRIMEKELTGNQHKLDKNKNGKLDKQDFKILRKEESIEEVAKDWKQPQIGDKVHFDHPLSSAPGHTVKKTGLVQKIEGDIVHVTHKSPYGVNGVIVYKKKASELRKEEVELEEETEQDTADYKVDKLGRKHKAQKIIFNKGEEEKMKEEKKTYKSFIEQHTLPLTEEQLDEIVSELQEVLGKDAKASEWIHDFVHSDNPKFAGKSKEKRKEMALGAYYAKQRNEEVEGLDEISSNLAARAAAVARAKRQNSFERGNAVAAKAHNDQANRLQVGSDNRANKETNKAFSDALKKARKRIQQNPLSAAKKRRMGEEVEELDEVDNLALRGLVSTDPKKAGRFLSTEKGKQARAEKNKSELKDDIKRQLGKHPKPNLPEEYMEEAIEDTLHPSGAALLKHIKPEHHNLYKPHLAKGTFNGSFKDRHDVLTAAHTAGHLKETTDYRNKYSYSTDRITGSGARHDIKKTATGIIATRRFSDNDHAEKPKDEPKRGRGRPKKDKFAEAVDFLIGLDEQTFDSLMEEGFDSFFEAFEHLNKE